MKFQVSHAGVPSGAGGNSGTIPMVAKLGLASEFSFGKNLTISKENEEAIKAAMDKTGLDGYSMHYAYWIACISNPDYHSPEKAIYYLVQACQYAKRFDIPVVVHPGGKLKNRSEQIELVISRATEAIEETGVNPALISFENMGRTSQFGDYPEVFILAKELNSNLCLDFSHLWARRMAEGATFDEHYVTGILKSLAELPAARSNAHIHISGMLWRDTGEDKHIRFKDSKFPLRMVLGAILDSPLEGGRIVIESDKRKMRDTMMVLSLMKELENARRKAHGRRVGVRHEGYTGRKLSHSLESRTRRKAPGRGVRSRRKNLPLPRKHFGKRKHRPFSRSLHRLLA